MTSFLKHSLPVFRRFGLTTVKKEIYPRIFVFLHIHPRVKTWRMDSDSDLGLESMFDEGLQCCPHIQEKRHSFITENASVPGMNDGGESSNLAKIPDVVHQVPMANIDTVCEDNVMNSSDDSIIQEIKKAKPKWKRKRKRKNKKMEDEIEKDEIMASDPDPNDKTEKQSNNNKKRKKKSAKNDNEDDNDDDNTKPPKKPRPNYFIAVRVSNPAIHSAFKVIQDSIIGKEPLLKQALIPLSTLHITLLVMHLEKEQLTTAVDVLQSCQSELKKVVNNQNNLTMTFQGLGHFKNEVVFGKMNNESEVAMLQQLALVIKNGFNSSELGVVFDDSSPLIPHLTLMKLSRIPVKKKKKKLRKIPPDTYSSWIDCELGTECFSNVLLCSMNDKKEDDGFYHSLGSVAITELLSDTESSLDTALNDTKDADEPSESIANKSTSHCEQDCGELSHENHSCLVGDSIDDANETSNNSNIDKQNFESSKNGFSNKPPKSVEGSMCKGKSGES